MEIKSESAKLPSVEHSLWKRLWTFSKAGVLWQWNCIDSIKVCCGSGTVLTV